MDDYARLNGGYLRNHRWYRGVKEPKLGAVNAIQAGVVHDLLIAR